MSLMSSYTRGREPVSSMRTCFCILRTHIKAKCTSAVTVLLRRDGSGGRDVFLSVQSSHCYVQLETADSKGHGLKLSINEDSNSGLSSDLHIRTVPLLHAKTHTQREAQTQKGHTCA